MSKKTWLIQPNEACCINRAEKLISLDTTKRFTRIEVSGDLYYAYVSEAERLAIAVLQGDEQAAIVLSDEVRMQYLEGEKFVSRNDLVRIVEEQQKNLKNLQLAISEYDMIRGQHDPR